MCVYVGVCVCVCVCERERERERVEEGVVVSYRSEVFLCLVIYLAVVVGKGIWLNGKSTS